VPTRPHAPLPVQLVLDGLAHRAPLVPDPPGPTGIRRKNPRHQGEIGLGDAIGWFARRHLTVSVPLADNQPYDLVVDVGGALARVQVKTTTRRSPYARYVVQLETRGGNQSFHTGRESDEAAVDLLYVLTDDGDRYVIPTTAVRSRRTLTLGDRYATFRAPTAPKLRECPC
jgi:hypothetical protein